MKKALTAAMLLIVFATPILAFAEYQLPEVPTVPGKTLTLKKIEVLVDTVIQSFITIAMLVLFGTIVYAGFVMVTSGGGDAKRFEEGKKLLIHAVFGGVVMLGVGLILATISDFAWNPRSIIY